MKRWRATFEGWKPEVELGTDHTGQRLEVPIKGPFQIEIREIEARRYRGFLLPSGQQFRGRAYKDVEELKGKIEGQFERQVEPWREVPLYKYPPAR